MKRIILLAFLSVIVYSVGHTQHSDSKYNHAIKESSRMLDSLQKNGKVPGLDVAIAINGTIIWSEAFGVADIEHGTSVKTGKTLFRIGSVSKPLTSAALGILMDQGKIDLDKNIQTYAPYFPKKRYPLTVRNIGGHIGGIRHYRGDEMRSKEFYPTVESGISIFSDDSLLFEPGTEYSYSSYGYNLLSAAIEGASGEEFLTFIQREVFDALDMTSTFADNNSSIILNRTSFYELDSNGDIINAPYVDNSYKWAGGGFISTTHDLIKFGEAHMQAGYLTENTLSELTTPQTLKNGNSTGYGIGWFDYSDENLKGYGHGGGSVGGITQFALFPEKKMVAVFLSNSSDTNYGNVVGRVIQLFLDAK